MTIQSNTSGSSQDQNASSQEQTARTTENALRRLLATSPDWAPLAVRLFLAAVMLPHGMQKLLGSFGGYGFDGTMGFFTDQMGLPWLLALLVILLEFFGPLLLIAGLGTRLVAAGFTAIMLGAITMVAGTNGFFMNWFGQQAGEGYEYHLLMVGMSISLMLSGGGRFSLDRKLTR